MENRNDLIIEELQAISCHSLASMDRAMPYKTTKDDYASTLTEAIYGSILVQDLPGNMPYYIDDAYFHAFPEILMEKIHLLEEEEDSVLSFNDKKSPFTVPENYFESFKVNIPQEEDPIIPEENIVSRNKVQHLWTSLNKYSVAAVLLLMLSVSGGLLLKHKENRKFYESMSNMNVNNEIAQVSTDDIANYLNDTPSKNIDYLINPTQSDKNFGVEMPNYNAELLHQSTPKEIEEYLIDDYDVL